MKNVVQDLTSAGLLGVWGKWMKHAKYIYNIQDFNPEQVLAVGYTKSKLITDAMMWFDKFSCKRSDLVITVGRDLVETVENRFKDKKVPKTVMINNWMRFVSCCGGRLGRDCRPHDQCAGENR